jgi:RNA polymerase sigma-70 factor (ECF subfamily)
LRGEPQPFYLWLRRLTWDRLARLHRHYRERTRGAASPEPCTLPSDALTAELAGRLLSDGFDPSSATCHEERRRQAWAALAQLAGDDREVLMLRHFERLPVPRIAALLEITEAEAQLRLLRALERFGGLLSADPQANQ